MKPAQAPLLQMARLLLMWLLLGWLGAERAESAPVDSSHAQQLHTLTQAESVESASLQPPDDRAGWQPQTLPDIWAQTRPDFSGTVWYRLDVELPLVPQDTQALWLPKVSMNAELWLNGQFIGLTGRMDDQELSRFWNTPLLFKIPSQAWQAGHNRLQLRVRARVEHAGGLAPVVLGPATLLLTENDRRIWRQNTLVAVCNVFVVSLGLFFLVVWTRQREKLQYGYFSAGAILLGFANSNMAVNHPPLPDEQWELLTQALMLWGPLMLALFALRFAGHGRRSADASAFIYAVIATGLLFWAGDRWRSLVTTLTILPVLILNGVALISLLKYVRRQPLRDHLLVGSAALAALGIGVHDWMIKAGLLPFEEPFAIPYMTPLLLSALCWLVAGDYARSQQNLARLNLELAQRIERREAELHASFELLAISERERATAAERSRILRDMHDGVGAHITSAMRQLEAGGSEPLVVAQTLRDSLDQLKLSIDAMNLPPGDVNALLASLRYRLQRRIETAGITLHWDVTALPHWPGGEHNNAMRHLQFIVFEGISNAMQHSRAANLTLSAYTQVDAICVALRDDGCGMDEHAVSTLRTLRERAALLDATLEVQAAAPGTRIVLRLPL